MGSTARASGRREERGEGRAAASWRRRGRLSTARGSAEETRVGVRSAGQRREWSDGELREGRGDAGEARRRNRREKRGRVG